ncbi:MAG TPA: DUF6421 family protein, partial [Amnibacterium sp.]
MSMLETPTTTVGQDSAAWLGLKDAVGAFRLLQQHDGSLREDADVDEARRLIDVVVTRVRELAPAFPSDAEYLDALVAD